MTDDQFGVKQIYPSKLGGELWFIDTNPSKDGRIILMGSRGTITYTGSDYYNISETDDVRIGIVTSDVYTQSKITMNHNILNEQGYMSTSKDWRNIEVTIYFKYRTKDDNDKRLVIYTRGGKHSKSRKCEGFSYKASLSMNNGTTHFTKEQWHGNQSNTDEHDTLALGNLRNKWIGFKFCIFNINQDKHVMGEIWVDKDDTNTWTKADSFVDQGGWGEMAGACQSGEGASAPDYIGIHGGPLIFYKWENDADFKKLSVREIDISLAGDNNPDPDPDPPPPPPPPPGGDDPPSTDPPVTGQVYATLIGVYNINFDESDGCSGLLVDVPPLQPIVTIPAKAVINMTNDRDTVGLITHDNSTTAGANPNDKSALIGKKIRRMDLVLNKYGGATGVASLDIRRGSDNTVIVNLGTLDVATLRATPQIVSFQNFNNSHRMTKNDRLVLYWNGGTALTYISVGINESDFFDGSRTCLVRREPNPSAYYVEDLTKDLAGTYYI